MHASSGPSGSNSRPSGWRPRKTSWPKTGGRLRSAKRNCRSCAGVTAAPPNALPCSMNSCDATRGLSAGVKEVLALAANPDDSAFQCVHGLVADVFHVSIEAAPLVEIALGQTAQHVVASRTDELLTRLPSQASRLGGRVGFLWLEEDGSAQPQAFPDLEGQSGVLGRVDRYVETEARFLALARRLLGQTWFVEKLGYAMELARSVGRGQTFVTLAGELVEPDGTLTIGPRNASSGLISRRSELRGASIAVGRVAGGD